MVFAETIMANKFSRSKELSLFIMFLFTLSTMSLSACSDNDNSTVSQRVVQAMVSFDDEGPVATAWVQDGNQNFVSDAILSINDRLFEVILLGDGESNEYSVPIYYLELYDLKGGDSLTLLAKRSDDTVIYAPSTAQIPMPMELLEPTSGQTILPGEPVTVRWAGGDGATDINTFYADNQGEELYYDIQKYGEGVSTTIPADVIREGGGIIGAAGVTGDYPLMSSGTEAKGLGSSFVIYRDAALVVEVPPYDTTDEVIGKRGDGAECPHNGLNDWFKARQMCTNEFVAMFVGAIVWGARWGIDAGKHPYCPILGGPLGYCTRYRFRFSPHVWVTGCLCPTKPK